MFIIRSRPFALVLVTLDSISSIPIRLPGMKSEVGVSFLGALEASGPAAVSEHIKIQLA